MTPCQKTFPCGLSHNVCPTAWTSPLSTLHSKYTPNTLRHKIHDLDIDREHLKHNSDQPANFAQILQMTILTDLENKSKQLFESRQFAQSKIVAHPSSLQNFRFFLHRGIRNFNHVK